MEAWDKLFTKMESAIQKRLQQKNKANKVSSQCFNNFITKLIGTSAHHPSFRSFKVNAAELIVETSVASDLSHLLNIPLQSGKIITAEILNDFIHLMKTDIWIPRCEQVIKWEQEQGIDKSKKRANSSTNENSHPDDTTTNTMNIENEVPILNPTHPKPFIYSLQQRIARTVDLLWIQTNIYIDKYMSPPWIYNNTKEKKKDNNIIQDLN